MFKLLEREKSLAKQNLVEKLEDLIQQPASIFSLVSFLPNIVLSTFDTLFTDNLWSRRAFIRSCIISAVTVILLLTLWYSTKPDNIQLMIDVPKATIGPPWPLPFREGSFANYAVMSKRYDSTGIHTSINLIIPVFLAPLIYNFLIDYAALVITKRMLINIKTRAQTSYQVLLRFIVSIPVLMFLANMGFGIYLAIVGFAMERFFRLPMEHSLPLPNFFSVGEFIRRIAFPLYNKYPDVLGQWTVHTIFGVFLCSTLVGSLWVGIFSIAVIFAKLVTKIRGLGPWLNSNFHVEQHPLEIMRWLLVIFLFSVCGILHLGSML